MKSEEWQLFCRKNGIFPLDRCLFWLFSFTFAPRMTNGGDGAMIRLLSFFLIGLSWFGVCQAETTDQERLAEQLPQQKNGIAWTVRPSDERRDQAMLSDARMWYRVCNTRPQRLAPTYGAGHGKPHGKPSLAIRQKVKSLKTMYDRRRKADSLPLRLVASCDYYVIALRHILR